MATNLGKVGIVMKGAWSNSATYEVLDAVSYNNSLYIAKQNVPANTVPTNTTYWQLALSSGLRVEMVEGTLADSLNVETTIPYPAGMNPSQLIIVGYTVTNGTIWYPQSGDILVFGTTGTGVRCKVISGSTFLGKTIRVMLMQIV